MTALSSCNRLRLRDKIFLKSNYCGEVSSLSFSIRDELGDTLVVYKDGYSRLSKETRDTLRSRTLDSSRKIAILQASSVPMIRYFSQANLSRFRVENILSIDQIPGIVTNGQQNCVVVNRNIVYVHPKVRCNPFVIGVNHSSLCNARAVDFAGSLIKRDNQWILNNTTGHYGTRASKLFACLQAFINNNISVEELYVEHWILVNTADPDNDLSYLIETVPVNVLLSRMAHPKYNIR